MPYDPRAIANHLLQLARADGEALSPMKLQKLVYFAHGWHLAIRGEPLLDRPIEAWTFGPVIPVLYRCFRDFGGGEITQPAFVAIPDVDYSSDESTPGWDMPEVDGDSERDRFTRSLLNRVWGLYGSYSAIELSNMTHEPGSPWHQVFTQHGGNLPLGTVLPPQLIRDHFVKMAEPKAVGA